MQTKLIKLKIFLERTIELTKDREIAAQFKIEMTKIREKALSENTPPSLHPDLKRLHGCKSFKIRLFWKMMELVLKKQ